MADAWIVVKQNNTFPIGTKFLGGPNTGLREAEFEKDTDIVNIITKEDKPIVYPFNSLIPYLMRMNLHKSRR